MAQLVLNIPDPMMPAVDEAIRSVYGGLLTPDMDTLAAMRAVARFWLANLMAQHAQTKARAAGDVKVEAAKVQREKSAEDAAKAARDAIAAIPWDAPAPSATPAAP